MVLKSTYRNCTFDVAIVITHVVVIVVADIVPGSSGVPIIGPLRFLRLSFEEPLLQKQGLVPLRVVDAIGRLVVPRLARALVPTVQLQPPSEPIDHGLSLWRQDVGHPAPVSDAVVQSFQGLVQPWPQV